jgi:diacylglycerol O-acyltransferase
MVVDRMSPLDATFLHVEDSVSHMHIASTLIFDGPPPAYEDLLEMISSKLHLVPKYRKVVRFVPLQLSRPVWVDDPYFHLPYHVRHTALPTPGGADELRRLVGRVMSQPLDRARPLWELWMVENYGDNQWAIMSKVHHCMVDGVSGTELLSIVLDIAPDPPRLTPAPWTPEPAPTGLELAVEAVGAMAVSPFEQITAVRNFARVPREALEQTMQLGQGLLGFRSLLRPTTPSSLNGPIGPHRRYDWAETSVDDIKRVRKSIGGTFNDVVLTAITGGFRSLLESRGETTDRVLRTMVPVSVRPRDARGVAVGDGSLANKVSAMFARLPIAVADPVERLHAVSAQLSDLKDSQQAVAGETLTSISGFAPPALLALGARLATKAAQRNVNTVTTNVPGPQIPLYVLGRRMRSAYPYVPLAGQIRIGIAIFSYDGAVTFGVTGDYNAAPDIGVLCQGIEDEMAKLLEVAG